MQRALLARAPRLSLLPAPRLGAQRRWAGGDVGMKAKKNNWVEVRRGAALFSLAFVRRACGRAHRACRRARAPLLCCQTLFSLSLTFPFAPQQNEVFRENQFNTWGFAKDNWLPLVVMVFVLPLTMHAFVKNEFAIRDQVREKPVEPRF